MKNTNYLDFIKKKSIISEKKGFEPNYLPGKAFPHQIDIVDWCIRGGRRAIFASFGLGKTFMQLMLAKNCITETKKHFLIVCPLGVTGEFKRDNLKLGTELELTYITNTNEIHNQPNQIFITNYERIRKGDIDASLFGGVSFDEASILRNLKTETTNFILSHFKKIKNRYVATATPSPNDYIEIINYADYLGVADRGHLLTRYFKRNSTKAGDLQLNETKKKEFWMWVSSWAVFLNKPSDLGYEDKGFDLPELKVINHCISYTEDKIHKNKKGDIVMFKDITKSLIDVSREKRDSLTYRVDKMTEILKENKNDNFILWHHLEAERQLISKKLKEQSIKSVYGSQKLDEKEKLLIDFSEGKFKYLSTKPKIAGSGCNFQGFCNKAIFVGIDYKFNDFIQAVHRIYRYGQTKDVEIHLIYTENEIEVFKTLMKKWEKHKELQKQMISLVKKYGLNENLIKTQMERQIFKQGDKVKIGNATLYNNDCVIAMDDIKENSIGLIVTSIPFGDHYEYSDNYNDFGHNDGNAEFFKQMDFLTPKLLKSLKAGRIACIHVKDRIRYSYQNGTSFTTIEDFSGRTVEHFTKNGFYLIGKITVTTDVVAENNQTYRLGWTEQTKDASKMGVGLPEYILIFRKAPTESNNAYADEPVTKDKKDYTICRWQLDAHAYWRSSGNVLMSLNELMKYEVKHIRRAWVKYQKEGLYDFNLHLDLVEEMEKNGKISRKFMTIPPISNSEFVWDDVRRTNTLNTNQTNKKKEKHICPLQLDLIERLIYRFSKEDEIVLDPFGGLMSVPYTALKMGRKAIGIELKTEYYKDGLFYVKSMHERLNVPTLFDVLSE